MGITSSYGRIISGQGRSSTSVNMDGQGYVSSQTRHWNTFRIRWSSGRETHSDWSVNGDAGDVMIAVNEDGRSLAECNAATGERWYAKATLNPFILVVGVVLIFLFGLGLIILAVHIMSAMKKARRWKDAGDAEINRVLSSPDFAAFRDAAPMSPA